MLLKNTIQVKEAFVPWNRAYQKISGVIRRQSRSFVGV